MPSVFDMSTVPPWIVPLTHVSGVLGVAKTISKSVVGLYLSSKSFGCPYKTWIPVGSPFSLLILGIRFAFFRVSLTAYSLRGYFVSFRG